MTPANELWPEREDSATPGEKKTAAKDPTKSRIYNIVKLLILAILYYVIIIM